MSDLVQQPLQTPWHVQRIQAILFPVSSQIATPQNWLGDLLKTDDVETVKRKLARSDSATVDGRHLHLAIEPERLTWTLDAPVDVEAITTEGNTDVPGIGVFNEQLALFRSYFETWLTSECPPLFRIAFTGTIVKWVSSRVDTYRLLAEYLHAVDVDPESTDLHYRINRKRKTTTSIPDLIINRLTAWSGVKLVIGGMSVAASPHSVGVSSQPLREFAGCQLVLDINSDGEYMQGLPKENILELWKELVALGVEIAEKGDIP